MSKQNKNTNGNQDSERPRLVVGRSMAEHHEREWGKERRDTRPTDREFKAYMQRIAVKVSQ